MRKKMVMGWLLLLLGGIVTLFWHNEWVYALPTPVPAHYKPVHTGDAVRLPQLPVFVQDKPVLLHFFNPDCPCSRFNIPYFTSLVHKYNSQAAFAIVLMTPKHYTEKEIQDKFHINIPVITDASLAATCGVYSTPQAVIIDAEQHLYYRGNYNKSRYCQNTETNYAEIALNALLLHTPSTVLYDSNALRAYGCQLPNCTKK
ncbi:AhpC/TSA family protein [Filimonas lacunae]|uniref:AhpC/TSA family protein n=1 Tax=Filimonas lacunae TaxID=477680 RepID=A0A173MAS3_9BACT|nr:redoxin domain-containing protein [Filimonas lacunae]BAV04636.1 AhpC/TSA family protein [Filimonas lacunae]SIT32558.1 AhpC/TSA family protein [Filimonas lacunae]